MFCEKGSLQQQYGRVPSGAYTAPSSHGNERRPSMNGGEPFGSYPWGYHPSGGYQDQSFGYGHNNNSNTFSHLMMVCCFCFISPYKSCRMYVLFPSFFRLRQCPFLLTGSTQFKF